MKDLIEPKKGRIMALTGAAPREIFHFASMLVCVAPIEPCDAVGDYPIVGLKELSDDRLGYLKDWSYFMKIKTLKIFGYPRKHPSPGFEWKALAAFGRWTLRA